MGPRTLGLWLGSTVFDGARPFEGAAPDLDRHCARVNQSAVDFGLIFLNGITRQWVVELLCGDGITVVEAARCAIGILAADEIFSTGNFAKVAPVIRLGFSKRVRG